MDMFFIFLLGFLIGALLVWYYLDSRLQGQIDGVQASWEGKVKHYETEIKNADAAHEETKEALRNMETANQACAKKVAALEARLGDAHSVSERSSGVEADGRRALEQAEQDNAQCTKELAEAKSRILELEARLRGGSSGGSGSTIDTPDAPLGFAGNVTAPDAKTRRLKALDAKIKQLPAGSSARKKLEQERASLTGTGQAAPSQDTDSNGDAGGDELKEIVTRPEGAPDDLKIIKGIGPVLEKKLNKLGIIQFAQVAALTSADIEKIDEVLDFKGRIERERWVEQAKDLI